MNSITANRMVNNYFRFLKDWDTDAKKDLINKLTASIGLKTKGNSDFSFCFGAWDDKRSADEITSELRADRVNQNEVEGF